MKRSLHRYQSKTKECKEKALRDRQGVTGEMKGFGESTNKSSC
jgi:hypothetical protein